MRVIEYTIITQNYDMNFKTKSDAQEFWDDLSKKERETGQFYKKEWIIDNGVVDEGEVIIYN
tara:strand:+ start:155 stop:340 length:186 start_codon:yes stop_codon:yes gene_type:complete